MKLIHKIFKHYILYNKKYIYLFTIITLILLLIFLYFNILFYHQMEGSSTISISRERYQNDILMRLVLVIACSFLMILFVGLYIDESGMFGHSGSLVFLLVTGLIAVNLYTLFFPFIQSYRESMIITPERSTEKEEETKDDISVVTTETIETTETTEIPEKKRKRPLKPSIKRSIDKEKSVEKVEEKSEEKSVEENSVDMSDQRSAAKKTKEKSVEETKEKPIEKVEEKSDDSLQPSAPLRGAKKVIELLDDQSVKRSYDFLDIDD